MTPTASNAVDLTRPIVDAMPVYPGDPCVRLAPALTLEADQAAVTAVQLGSHTGTHVDAPAHFVPGGRTVDRLTLDELCGPAAVLHLAGLSPAAPVTAVRLAPLLGSVAGRGDGGLPGAGLPPRLFLSTGWDGHFDDDALRARHPHLTAEAAHLLWDAGVRLLGVDTLSPDPTDAPSDWPAHAVFLGRDGAIVENLTGLTTLAPAGAPPGRDWAAACTVTVLPLPLEGADGAPARVIAVPGA